MRTTLTLDDDIVIALKRLQEQHRITFKELVNRALREGMLRLEAAKPERATFVMPTASLGVCRLPNLDNVAEALAIAEGDDFR